MSYGDSEVFVKCDTREMLPIFTAEADQLALLARSKTVRVPEVYGVGSDRDYSFLLLEYQPLKPLDAHGRTVSGNNWPACTSGANNRSLASTSITTFPPRRSPTPGNAAGQNFLPSNASAGSYSWRRKGHDLR